MPRQIWFDEVGLAYAKNWAELEGARELLAQQCESIAESLRQHVVELPESQRILRSERNKKNFGEWDFYLGGEFEAARIKHKKKKAGTQAGASFYFGEWEDGDETKFGLRVELWFRMNPKGVGKQLGPLPDDFEGPKPFLTRRYEGGWTLVDLYRVPVEEDVAAKDSMEEAVSAISEIFDYIDPLMARHYVQMIRAGGEDEGE